MKEIRTWDVLIAMARLYNKDWFVNDDNLGLLIEYFREPLLEMYNQDKPEEDQVDIDKYDAKFDQWCVDYITNLFN